MGFRAPSVLVAVAAAATGCGAVLLQPPPQKSPSNHEAHAGGKKGAGATEPMVVNRTMRKYLSDCQCGWARQAGSCDTDDKSHCWGVCCELGKRSNCKCSWARKPNACDLHSRDGSQCWKECCDTLRYGIIQAEILNHKQGSLAAEANASQAMSMEDAAQVAQDLQATAATYAPQAHPFASNLGNLTEATETAAEIMDEYTLAGENAAPKITGEVSAVNATSGSISGSHYIFGNASRNSTSSAGRASGAMNLPGPATGASRAQAPVSSYHVAVNALSPGNGGNKSYNVFEDAAANVTESAAGANISSGVNVMTPKGTVWEDQN